MVKLGLNSQNYRLIWEKNHNETPGLWFSLVTLSLLIHIAGLVIIYLWWQHNQLQQSKIPIELITIKSTSEAKTAAIKPIKGESPPQTALNSNSQPNLYSNPLSQKDLPAPLTRPLAIPLDNPQPKPPPLSSKTFNSEISPVSPKNSPISSRKEPPKQSQTSNSGVDPKSKPVQQPLTPQSQEPNLGLWHDYEPNTSNNQQANTSQSTKPEEITTDNLNQRESNLNSQSLLPPIAPSDNTETQEQQQPNLATIPENLPLNPPLSPSNNPSQPEREDINDTPSSLIATIGNFALSNSGGAIPSQLAQPIENTRSLDAINYLASFDVKIKGTVVLETLVVIDNVGTPTVLSEYTKVVQGDLDLAIATKLAKEIIESWTFKPTYQDNQPTFGDYSIRIELKGS